MSYSPPSLSSSDGINNEEQIKDNNKKKDIQLLSLINHALDMNEIDDSAIQVVFLRPKQPFLHGRAEVHDIEAAHERRVKVCQLVLVSGIYGTDDAAAVGQSFPGKFPVQGEVHDGLQYLRSGTVELVEEEDNRLAVEREPVWRHEVGLACLFVFGGDADKVARVGHLSEEKCDYRHAFLGVVVGQYFRFADSMLADKHDVLLCRDNVEQPDEFSRIDFDIRHDTISSDESQI